jgi:Zn-dependent peptidase ImmA (M78 family)/DNA-binding XRE family transcriptional regulator
MKPGTPGFVGRRLKLARDARGISAISLADLLGVSAQAISQYENGHNSPAPEVMKSICDVLNLPLHFFLKPPARSAPGVLFARSMHSATKEARTRAEGRYEWFREIVAYLRNFVAFSPVKFPDFDLSADPAGIAENDIERIAVEVRRQWGLGDGPISNVAWLLENNGAIIARHKLGSDKLDAFSEWTESGVPYIIFGADKGSTARSRYDAGHELGHMILHRSIRDNAVLQKTPTFALIEAQANRFAGAFLLPSSTFAEDFYTPSIDSLRVLKSKWKVSIAFMIMRAGDLGLVSSDQKRRLLINLARRGWRLKEPLDDELEPEMPRYLRRCFDLLIDNGIVRRNEIPFQLALPENDIEELAGLPRGYFTETLPPLELRDANVLPFRAII